MGGGAAVGSPLVGGWRCGLNNWYFVDTTYKAAVPLMIRKRPMRCSVCLFQCAAKLVGKLVLAKERNALSGLFRSWMYLNSNV